MLSFHVQGEILLLEFASISHTRLYGVLSFVQSCLRCISRFYSVFQIRIEDFNFMCLCHDLFIALPQLDFLLFFRLFKCLLISKFGLSLEFIFQPFNQFIRNFSILESLVNWNLKIDHELLICQSILESKQWNLTLFDSYLPHAHLVDISSVTSWEHFDSLANGFVEHTRQVRLVGIKKATREHINFLAFH